MDEPTAKSSRLRPRFSLLTVLLLMTITGLLLVIWRQWRDVQPLRAELERLRLEQGHLNIKNPKKIYLVDGSSHEDGAWLWRIYLPPDRKYVVYRIFGDVPPRTTELTKDWFEALKLKGASGLSGTAFRGEVMLEARRVHGAGVDEFGMKYSSAYGSAGSGSWKVPLSDELPFDRRMPLMATSGMNTTQREFEPDKPFVILHNATPNQNGGFDGQIIWIEPAEDTALPSSK